MNIDKHVSATRLKWYNSKSHYTKFDERYSKDSDKSLIKLKTDLISYIETFDPDKSFDSEDEVMIRCRSFMVKTMGVSKWAADQVFNKSYMTCSQDFIKRAKEVKPDLDRIGLFQALRNVWTMNSMQIYFTKEIKLTDAMFAYSMLYPLTDNYLDDPHKTKESKYEFNQRFLEKIQSGSSTCKSDEEATIFKMIDLIEGEYDRECYPGVFSSLSAILKGQTLSLKQQGIKSPYSADLLGISIYKGGASVLADAYLVAGQLDHKAEEFAFNYGVLLQFADDLQDIEEDKLNHHATVFNSQSNLLDESICMYLNMMDQFFETVMVGETDQEKALQEIMALSLSLLVYTALLTHKKYISKDLFNKIKKANVFSLRTYKKVERQFNKHLSQLMNKLL